MNCLTTSPQWKRLPKLLNKKDPRIVQYQRYSSGRIPRSTHPSSRHQRMVMLSQGYVSMLGRYDII